MHHTHLADTVILINVSQIKVPPMLCAKLLDVSAVSCNTYVLTA